MKVKVLGVDGNSSESMDLPFHFEEAFRPDLIKRAFWALQSLTWQPKGAFPLAGLQNTAEYYGRRHAWRQTINTGRSRLPREKLPGGRSGRVLSVPHAVKGRRAHPPKPEKILIEKINKKEKNLAVRSAIAATANSAIVSTRGHSFNASLPLVVSNSFEQIKKTKDAFAALGKIGLGGDLLKTSSTRVKKTGISRLRRGDYKERKTVLVVLGGKDEGAEKAFRNIPGVDCVSVEKLNVGLLAPGGTAGRITIWTQTAIERLGKEKLFL